MTLALGVDLGGTLVLEVLSVLGVLVKPVGTVLARERRSTPAQDGPAAARSSTR